MKTRVKLAGGLVAIGLAITVVAVLRPTAPDAPTARPPPGPGEATDPVARPHTASVERGAGLFGRCAACHSIGRLGEDHDGPNLYGVVDAPVAQRRGRFAYTAALRRVGGVWTAARLDAWLADPRAFAPGTSMRFAGLPDPGDRADLIAYLATQGAGPPRP